MNYPNKLAASLIVLAALASANFAQAQNRTIGANKIILDDGAGRTLTLQTPSPLSGPVGGNVNWTLPVPPAGNPASGFVNVGTAPGQMLFWNSTNLDWETSNIITNNANGSGLNVTIAAPLLATASSNIFGSATNLGTTLNVRNDGNSNALVTSPVQINAIGTSNALTFLTTGSGLLDISGTGGAWSVAKTGAASVAQLNVATGKFNVDVNGNLNKINNVTTNFPGGQGAVGSVLTNDGSGNLSWAVAGANSAAVVSTNSTYTGGGSLGSNQNDLPISATGTYFKINATANVNVTGINSTGTSDGRVVYFSNVGAGAFTVTFNNQNGGSAANDQFLLPGASDVTISPNSSAVFIYDATAHKWRLISSN